MDNGQIDHGQIDHDHTLPRVVQEIATDAHRRAAHSAITETSSSPPLSEHERGIARGRNQHVEANGGGQQSDSEAETVVLPTPERKNSSRKFIKTERNDEKERFGGLRRVDTGMDNTIVNGNKATTMEGNVFERHHNYESKQRFPTPKRSPDLGDEDSPSTNVTHRTSERGYRETFQLLPRKRKLSDRASDETARKLRPQHRSATYDLPLRSPSPPATLHRRAASTQSVLTNGQRNWIKTWQSPSASTKHLEGELSDSSCAGRSPDPRVRTRRKERSVASPADVASHKTHKRKGDLHGRTALYRACEEGWLQQVPDLLQQRPEDLDKPDNAGNTPLQTAALGGYTDIVSILIEAGCQIDCVNSDKDTPLIDAIENSHLDVVRLLLDAGVDPRRPNLKGERPLDLVHKVDDEVQEEMKEALLSAINRSAHQHPPDDLATSYSAGSRAHSVESARMSPSMSRSPPLGTQRRRTARTGATRRKDLMYLKTDTISLKDYAGKGDGEAVEYLLNAGVRADNSCMVAAAQGDHIGVMNILLADGGDADPDPETTSYETPLLATIGRGHLEMLCLLIGQENFNASRQDRQGRYYHEIARDRQGPNWQAEVDILKRAFDQYPSNSGRQSPNLNNIQNSDKLHRRKRKISMDSPTRKRDSTAKRMKPDKPDKHSHDSVRPKRRSESDSFTAMEASRPKRKLVSNGYREQKRHSIAIVSDSDSELDDLATSRQAGSRNLGSLPLPDSSDDELPSSSRPRRLIKPDLSRALKDPPMSDVRPPPMPVSEDDYVGMSPSNKPMPVEKASAPLIGIAPSAAQSTQQGEDIRTRDRVEIASQLEVLRTSEVDAEAKRLTDTKAAKAETEARHLADAQAAKAKAEAAYQRRLAQLPRFSLVILVPGYEIDPDPSEADDKDEQYLLSWHAAVLLGLGNSDMSLAHAQKIPTTEAQRLYMLPHYREMMNCYAQMTSDWNASEKEKTDLNLDKLFMELAVCWVSFNVFLTTVREGLEQHKFEHIRGFEITTRTSVHVDWVPDPSKSRPGSLTRAQLLRLHSQGFFGVAAAAEAKKLEPEPGVYVDGRWKESAKASRDRKSQHERGKRWL